MPRILIALWNDESGEALAEYGLLASLTGATLIAALAALGVQTRETLMALASVLAGGAGI